MEEFRKKLKVRRIVYAFLLVAIIGIMVLETLFYFGGDSFNDGFFAGFQTGLSTVFFVMCIANIINYSKALKNDDLLKKIYIKENDERLKAIREKSGGSFYQINYIVLLVCAIGAGFINYLVMFTLIGALMLMIIINSSLYYYYSRKL